MSEVIIDRVRGFDTSPPLINGDSNSLNQNALIGRPLVPFFLEDGVENVKHEVDNGYLIHQ